MLSGQDADAGDPHSSPMLFSNDLISDMSSDDLFLMIPTIFFPSISDDPDDSDDLFSDIYLSVICFPTDIYFPKISG